MIERICAAFKTHYGKGELIKFFSPGRVNLIGEHLDYNGGMVLPSAISLGIYAVVRYNDTRTIRIRSLEFENEVFIDLDDKVVYDKSDGWGNYPKGVIALLIEKHKDLRGFDAVIGSTLPQASGLSSSAALEVLSGFIALFPSSIFADRNEPIDLIELAKIAQRAENEFVGMNCGIMDQFAVTMGKKDNAILLNSRNLRYQYVPADFGDYTIVIMNTNKPRTLASSKFNERREECERAYAELKKHIHAPALVEATLTDVHKYIENPLLQKRAKHVVGEQIRVMMAVEDLGANSIENFGKLLKLSHESLRDNFEVSCFELDTIVEAALSEDYCIGARMTGAGFGGCAIALVETKRAGRFEKHVAKHYREKTGIEPSFYVCRIDDGIRMMG